MEVGVGGGGISGEVNYMKVTKGIRMLSKKERGKRKFMDQIMELVVLKFFMADPSILVCEMVQVTCIANEMVVTYRVRAIWGSGDRKHPHGHIYIWNQKV